MAVAWIPFRFPGLHGVRCAFQTRALPSEDPCSGGNISFLAGRSTQSVRMTRQELLTGFGVEDLAELHQVHGNRLLFDPEPASSLCEPLEEGDGMATNRPGLALMIKTADCQPVLLTHCCGRYIMALHVGWRGNRMDFIASAVAQFCEHYDLRPEALLAVRGPSLGPAQAEFIHFDQEWGTDFARWFRRREQTMDLWNLTRHQLMQAGLPPSQIFGLDYCTFTNEELFFSYRRDRNRSGRQGNFIWIE